ncbi:MAG: DUF3572 domain-containing protein [Sphingomonas sp.]|uniref:DUF3572 domain-containing protein n=1 Tax=Sphingomonas sp. TaxID=28214 RepID=UPI003F7F1510
MNPHETNDAPTLALHALAWTLADSARARRLLDLTGLDADTLRGSAASRGTQAAVLGFLEAHEPDLIACAADLDVKPEAMIAARHILEGSLEA